MKFNSAAVVLVLLSMAFTSCGVNDRESVQTSGIVSVGTTGTAPEVKSSSRSDADEKAEKLYYSSEQNVKLVVFRCGITYLTFNMYGNDRRWVELYGNLPDKGLIKDGCFGLITADITRLSGGEAGYKGVPRIDKLISAETMELRDAVRICEIKTYSREETVYSEPLVIGDNIIVDLGGVYYVYSEGKSFGTYGNSVEAEAALGISEYSSDSHINELHGLDVYLIRCGDKLLAYSFHVNTNRFWTPILNERFEDEMLGFSLEDGEVIMLRHTDIVLMNGGSAGYVNAPLIRSFAEITEIGADSLAYDVIKPGDPKLISETDNAKICLAQGGVYLIFLVDGRYHVYRCKYGKKSGLIGTFDTIDAALSAIGYNDR